VKINETQNQQHQRKANQISLSCRLEPGSVWPFVSSFSVLSSLIKAVFHVDNRQARRTREELTPRGIDAKAKAATRRSLLRHLSINHCTFNFNSLQFNDNQ